MSAISFELWKRLYATELKQIIEDEDILDTDLFVEDCFTEHEVLTSEVDETYQYNDDPDA